MKSICISSSVSNFNSKLKRKYYDYSTWDLSKMFDDTIFFGVYHVGDYTRLLAHRGKRTIFWCGTDILNLEKTREWKKTIASIKAEHVCENEVEKDRLRTMGIHARIHPMFFDEPSEFEPCFKPSKTPHVFLTAHEPSKETYGIDVVENISTEVPKVTFHIYGVEGKSQDNIEYHGVVSNTVFNKEIKDYQAALRLNVHDGFAETLGKSILCAQYPISVIKYPHIDYAPTLNAVITLLKNLKNKHESNLEARNYWYNVLSKPI